MEKKANRRQIAVGVILTTILMMLAFFICRGLKLPYMSGLHLINNVLVIPVVWFAIHKVQRLKLEPTPYLRALSSGVGAAGVSGLLFSFFLLIYLTFINPYYLFEVRAEAPLGEFMSPMVIALVFLTEQVCSALIASLIIMQAYKSK
jgi:hypothetical protein